MDAVEEIKSRLSVEDVVSEYVQLKRAGRNYKGLSPFTSEKTPSFTVSPEKQIWHDFSSNRGGDMFTFVQEMEGLDFKGALELLARKAGVDLEQFQRAKPGDTKQKDRLYELNELAARFYQVQFTKNQTALRYVLKKRAFSKDTAITWRLGYAPNTGNALVDFALHKGFTKQELQSAGLTNRYGGDLFRSRLMIPLCDPTGRVIGFTARILEDEPNAPKYLNTPQTPLYDKSRHVYGLHLAKETIRKSKFVVLAEGNLDVIASHQAGVRQCVATAGTALTAQQLKALGRFTGDIRLCFDADRAGLAATERAIPIASSVGVTLGVISIPSGKDPDELIKQDVELWHKTVTESQPALDWLIGRYSKELDLTNAVGKRQFSDIIIKVIRELNDSVEQEHYLQRVSKIIGISLGALKTKLEQPAEAPRLKKKKTDDSAVDEPEGPSLDMLKAQNRLVALLLMQPKLRDIVDELDLNYFYQEHAKSLLEFLREHPDFAGDASHAAGLRPLSEYVKILALQYEELYQDLELIELRNEAERLQSYLVAQYVKTEKAKTKRALDNADASELQRLLTRDKELNELLRRYNAGA